MFRSNNEILYFKLCPVYFLTGYNTGYCQSGDIHKLLENCNNVLQKLPMDRA